MLKSNYQLTLKKPKDMCNYAARELITNLVFYALQWQKEQVSWQRHKKKMPNIMDFYVTA